MAFRIIRASHYIKPLSSTSLIHNILADFFYTKSLFVAVLIYYTYIQWVFASSCNHRCETHCVVVACYFEIVILLLFCYGKKSNS